HRQADASQRWDREPRDWRAELADRLARPELQEIGMRPEPARERAPSSATDDRAERHGAMLQSIQAGSTKTPSPPSGRSEPMAISTRPSSPASNARTVAGLTRTTSQQRSSRISSSSLTCPEPLMTT